MHKDFKEYWEDKKEIFKKLGVSKEAAHMIWCDAVNCLGFQLALNYIKK